MRKQHWVHISAPSRATISPGSGFTWSPQSRHHTINHTPTAAALPNVIGAPGSSAGQPSAGDWRADQLCVMSIVAMAASFGATLRRPELSSEPDFDDRQRMKVGNSGTLVTTCADRYIAGRSCDLFPNIPAYEIRWILVRLVIAKRKIAGIEYQTVSAEVLRVQFTHHVPTSCKVVSGRPARRRLIGSLAAERTPSATTGARDRALGRSVELWERNYVHLRRLRVPMRLAI